MKRGRPTNATRARALELLKSGRDVDSIADELALGKKARTWLGREALNRARDAAPPAPAPTTNGAAPLETPDAVIAETFGPMPAAAPPPNGAAPPPVDDDPLARPITQAELVGMGDMVVGTVDSMLATTFGGPPAQGMTDGQRGFLKAFHRRIANAIEQLTDASKMKPGDVLLLTLAVLIVPRGVQRVGGFMQRRRAARGAVPGRSENGKDARGGGVGADASAPPIVPTAGA